MELPKSKSLGEHNDREKEDVSSEDGDGNKQELINEELELEKSIQGDEEEQVNPDIDQNCLSESEDDLSLDNNVPPLLGDKEGINNINNLIYKY